MSLPYFSVQNIECARNNRALFSRICFSLNPGDITHIRGENGIGKTTLLRSLAGLSKPLSGEIYWQGKDIFKEDEYKDDVFLLGHKNTVKSSLTVYENLNYSASLSKIKLMKDIVHVIEEVGLISQKDLSAGSLSSGQKQRLALAKLLLTEAKVWILDEPFTSLDNEGVIQFQSLMIRHLNAGGVIIFTSHQPILENLNGYSAVMLVSAQDNCKR